jgi:hypothetical protein
MGFDEIAFGIFRGEKSRARMSYVKTEKVLL